jgi:hypothetical protein
VFPGNGAGHAQRRFDDLVVGGFQGGQGSGVGPVVEDGRMQVALAAAPRSPKV